MMCASLFDLKSTLEEFQMNDIDYLHIDIMDGVFVPNLMLCEGIVKQYREIVKIPFDYHLMIVDPLEKINWFGLQENDLLSFHLEACKDVKQTLDCIHAKKAKAGIAIKPSTPVSQLLPYIQDVDFVVIMTVNPGFAGQKLLLETLDKISEARELFDKNGRKDVMIEVDGNVSFVNAKIMREKGADLFVAGTSSVFKKGLSIKEGIEKLREAIR